MNARFYRLLPASLVVVLFVSVTTTQIRDKERLTKLSGARDGDLQTAEECFRALVAEDEKYLSSSWQPPR
jgi:hypothetical protein